MRKIPGCLFLLAVFFTAALAAPSVRADDTVKIGVLHSLSGTMAISETSLRDVVLMAVDEINASGRRAGQDRSSRSSSTRPPTGRCLPKRPSS